MSNTLTRTELTGTMDELEPALRARGFVAVQTMAGPIDLSTFDPYGMRRSDSPNIRGVWLNSIFRGCLAYAGDVAYLAGKEPENGSAFVGGLFPLLTAEQVSEHFRRERLYAHDAELQNALESSYHGTYGDQS